MAEYKGVGIGVVQILANHDPDMDAMYRLTRPLPVTFNVPQSKAILIKRGTYAPFNAQSTLFFKSAFWGLLLPVTVHGRVTDIWRSYLMERIMEELDLRVVFAAPFVEQIRNPHDYLTDFINERPLYEDAERLILLLKNEWTRETASVDKVYVEAMEFLYMHDIVQQDDVELARAFMDDLKSFHYSFPKFIGRSLATAPPIIPALVPIEAARETLAEIQVAPELPEWRRETHRKRTAICVTGQIRTLNMNPTDDQFPTFWEPMFIGQDLFIQPNLPQNMDVVKKMTLSNSTTVAQTIQANLFSQLDQYDVYMYVGTGEGKHEPRIGDTSICTSLNATKCVVTEDSILPKTPTIRDKIWDTFFYSKDDVLRTGLLKQMYHLEKCNDMVLQSGIKYDYMIRLRPDMAFARPISPPSLTLLPGKIRVISKTNCCCGNEDLFAMGTFEDMQVYMNRLRLLNHYPGEENWSSETFLTWTMKHHGLEYVFDDELYACLVKPKWRKKSSDP